MEHSEYEALRKLMRTFPLKLERAREKYLRYIQDASKIAMSDQLSDIDKQILEFLNQKEDIDISHIESDPR